MSIHLDRLYQRIDNAEKIYSVTFLATADLLYEATRHQDAPTVFMVPGSFAPFRRPPMLYEELREIAPKALLSMLGAALVDIGIVLNEFLYQTSRRAYEHQTKQDFTNRDNTWFRMDMIQAVTGVDPTQCVCYDAARKIDTIMAYVRDPTSPLIDELNQRDFFDLCKAIKGFAQDFELALTTAYPALKL